MCFQVCGVDRGGASDTLTASEVQQSEAENSAVRVDSDAEQLARIWVFVPRHAVEYSEGMVASARVVCDAPRDEATHR